MRARRILVTVGLVGAIVLASPAAAWAASGSCLSETAAVNGSDAIHIPPLTGVGFSCLVDSMRPYADGLVAQLLPLAKMLLALALIAELAWCGLFGGAEALNKIGRAFMRALLTTVLLETGMIPMVEPGGRLIPAFREPLRSASPAIRPAAGQARRPHWRASRRRGGRR